MDTSQSFAALLIALCLIFSSPLAIAQADNRLNVNSASAEEMATVPGLTPEMAVRIVQYRDDMGDIQHLDELLLLEEMYSLGINRELLQQWEQFLEIYHVCYLPMNDSF